MERIQPQREPVPFEEIGMCSFYAVQDAMMYFDQEPLMLALRNHMQWERDALMHLLSQDKEKGIAISDGLIGSLQLVLPRLAERRILPTKYIAAEETQEIIEQSIIQRLYPSLEYFGESFEEMDKPTLLITETAFPYPSQHHIWFCPNQEAFERDSSLHMPHYASVILAINVEKIKSTK